MESQPTARARARRRDPAPAEALLWWVLRHREPGSCFRRKHPVGPHIADFACVQERLAAETDGDSPTDPEREARRDRYFAEKGRRVIRLCDSDVYERLEEALEEIWTELHGPQPPE